MTATYRSIVMIAAAAAGASAALYRHAMRGYPRRAVKPSVLSPKEQAVVGACADAFFPGGGPIPLSGTEAGLVAYMDAYVRRLPDGPAYLARLLFHFIEHVPWVVGPRRVRFTKLSHADRLTVLETMRANRVYFLRVAFLSMRTMLTMGYLANPLVTRAMRMEANVDPFGLDAGQARGAA